MKIRITKKLTKEIERLAKKKGVSKSEFAQDALRRYVGVMRFRELRAETIQHVEALGIRVDDVAG